MDTLDLAANKSAREYFVGLTLPCPSRLCDGFLDEYVQESWQPFKAFLMCPNCESRLRVWRKEK
jgi:hypothetical protein